MTVAMSLCVPELDYVGHVLPTVDEAYDTAKLMAFDLAVKYPDEMILLSSGQSFISGRHADGSVTTTFADEVARSASVIRSATPTRDGRYRNGGIDLRANSVLSRSLPIVLSSAASLSAFA